MPAVKTATLDDYTISKFEILGYGPSGSGKTYFMQFLPRPFIFDIDRGLKTLARLPNKPALQFLPRVDGPPLTYDQIMLVVAKIAADPHSFGDTICVDNLGELEHQMLKEKATKGKREYAVPEQEDYKGLNVKIMDFVTALRSLPVNLYITTGEKATYEARTGNVLHLVPNFTNATLARMPHHFDEVYHFSNTAQGEYNIKTSGDGIAYAKSRLRIPNNLSHKGVAKALIDLTNPSSANPSPVSTFLQRADARLAEMADEKARGKPVTS
jgi:phage nucleotide-binding protein